VIGLREQDALDRLGIEPGVGSGIGTGAVEQEVVVGLELGCRLLQGVDEFAALHGVGARGGVGQEDDPLRQCFLRAGKLVERFVALLRRHHFLEQYV